jgi:hypothetical protein
LNAAPAPNLSFDFPVLEDADSVQVALMQVMRLILSGQLEPKAAGLLLYALQTASLNLRHTKLEPFIRECVVIDPSSVAEIGVDDKAWDESDFEAGDDEEEDEEDDEQDGGDDEEEEDDADEDDEDGGGETYHVKASKENPLERSAGDQATFLTTDQVRRESRRVAIDTLRTLGLLVPSLPGGLPPEGYEDDPNSP